MVISFYFGQKVGEAKKDPLIDKTKIHKNNRKRVLRALEVLNETNNSINITLLILLHINDNHYNIV